MVNDVKIKCGKLLFLNQSIFTKRLMRRVSNKLWINLNKVLVEKRRDFDQFPNDNFAFFVFHPFRCIIGPIEFIKFNVLSKMYRIKWTPKKSELFLFKFYLNFGQLWILLQIKAGQMYSVDKKQHLLQIMTK